jgi:hypothetical protein
MGHEAVKLQASWGMQGMSTLGSFSPQLWRTFTSSSLSGSVCLSDYLQTICLLILAKLIPLRHHLGANCRQQDYNLVINSGHSSHSHIEINTWPSMVVKKILIALKPEKLHQSFPLHNSDPSEQPACIQLTWLLCIGTETEKQNLSSICQNTGAFSCCWLHSFLNTASVAQLMGFCQNLEDSAMMLACTQKKWQLRHGKENTKHTCHILHRK